MTTPDLFGPEVGAAEGIEGAFGGRAKGRVLSTGGAAARNRARLGALLERFWGARRAEVSAQVERWTLWTPVSFGGGAAIYMCAYREPDLAISCAAAAAVILATWAARRWGRSRLLVMALSLLAFGLTGFAAGVVKARIMASPTAPADRKPVTVEGWVVDVLSNDAAHQRLLIAPTYISGLSVAQTPSRVRVSLKSAEGLVGPGQPIRMRAILGPPPPPSAPEAYDFARDAYFSGIGGSGLAIGSPQVIDLPPPTEALQLQLAVNAGRWSLARRLVARMGDHEGGLAAALTTGHQAWLDPVDVQAMRDSGLAHILSISGVHMAIVGGFVFGALRLLIAAWPWAALRVSGKKVAAVGGIVSISAYLVLSGAPAPAIRSALTACIAFLAVLLDRRAISLHSLAIAALVVLVLQPEAVAQPGFQMSFAATAALLALAEAWPHGGKETKAPRWIKLLQGLRTWLIAGAAVSLVAGLATDPFSIQHFNRVTLWGLPANVSSELLSSFVMPMLALGCVAELFGVGGPFLWAAGWGLEGIALTAKIFAAAPHAVVWIPSAPNFALGISFFGLLVVCIWRGKMRWLGAPLFLAVWAWPRPAPPDLWIAGEGANVAVADHGQAILLRPRSQLFGYQLWARRRGYAIPADLGAVSEEHFDCGRDDCTPTRPLSVSVAGWWRRKPPTPGQIGALCETAEVVIERTGDVSSEACAGKLLLGESALARGGAAEVWRAPSPSGPAKWRIVWSEDRRGHRPWTAPETLDEAGDPAPSDSGG